jgi:RHS repeat-associated protein
VRTSDGTTPTDYTYTGQYSNVSDFGLLFYDARWYDPAPGRFTQPDSIVPNAADPQSWDRYAYALNNPMRFVDPTGHRVACGVMGEGCESTNAHGTKLDKERDGSEAESGGGRRCYDFGGASGYCSDYVSASGGLDLPTLAMTSGLLLSAFAPAVGVPLGLGGAAFEMAAYTGNPLAVAVKSMSLGVTGTLDAHGNLYGGPQVSIGKSLLPVISVGVELGTYFRSDRSLTQTEMRDSLSGPSVSAGSIATGGVNFSPFAKDNRTAVYYPIPPEVVAASAQFTFWLHDFTP